MSSMPLAELEQKLKVQQRDLDGYKADLVRYYGENGDNSKDVAQCETDIARLEKEVNESQQEIASKKDAMDAAMPLPQSVASEPTEPSTSGYVLA